MKDLYHSLLRKMAHFQVTHPWMTILLLAMLTVAMLGGVSQVKTVASLEQMMPKDVQEIHAFNTLRDNGMGQDVVAIVIQVDRDSTDSEGILDIRDRRVYDYVRHVSSLVGQETDVLETYDYADVIDQFSQGNTNSETYQAILKDPRAQGYISNFINEDYTTTIIIATTDVGADDPRMNLLAEKIRQDVQSAGLPPGVKVSFTGTPLIQQKLGTLIAKDRNSTQWISTLLVFIIVMMTFGTLTSAIVPIIVVTMSVNWLYGTMGYGNLPISTLAGGVAAMVIGIGIDFAIHIMNKFKYERKKGGSISRSIEDAVVETGTALTATSLTTMSAFLAFLVGAMPEMGRFGVLMAIGVSYSLVFSLFGLPALLVIEEKAITLLRKRLKFGVEGEYKLQNKEETC